MFPQYMEKTAAHASGSNHILAVPDLPHLAPHNLCDPHPARNADHKGNTDHICLTQNSLQQNDHQQNDEQQQTNASPGTLSSISVSRIISPSAQSGAQPLAAPNTIAAEVESNVAAIPINRETLPPYQIMEKISLPIVSVPKRNSPHGETL